MKLVKKVLVKCTKDFSFQLPYYLHGLKERKGNMCNKGEVYKAEIYREETDYYIRETCCIYYEEEKQLPFVFRIESKNKGSWGISDNLYRFDDFFEIYYDELDYEYSNCENWIEE